MADVDEGVISAATAAIRFLALGDSYTIGEALPASDRWPVQLASRLRVGGIPIANPRIIARTGWAADELAAALDRAGVTPPWDLVSLSIGVNDQYRGRPLKTYRGIFQALLERAIALAGGLAGRVLVLSIPDWSATPFGAGSGRDLTRMAAELAEYNAAKREISLARGVTYEDITPSTRAMANDPLLVAADGLHPSAELYRRWVDQLEEPLRALLLMQCSA